MNSDDLFDTDLLDEEGFKKHQVRADNPYDQYYGIYSIDGDTLTICISDKKEARPTTLQSKAGSDHLLIVLKREKTAPGGSGTTP